MPVRNKQKFLPFNQAEECFDVDNARKRFVFLKQCERHDQSYEQRRAQITSTHSENDELLVLENGSDEDTSVQA